VRFTLAFAAGLRRHVLFVVAAAAALFTCRAAPAALVITAQSVTAHAGDSGDALDVTLTNTGSSAVQVQGFSFRLSTDGLGINFDSASTATTTAPYIFASHSAFGPQIDTGNGATLQVSDVYDTNAGITVGAGATMGLGEVLFDVAPNTPTGPVNVILAAYPATSLNGPGPNFDNIPVGSLTNGTITIVGNAAAVPEPMSVTLLGVGVVCCASYGWLRRKRAVTHRSPETMATRPRNRFR
jgi:hypothetical protein